MSANEGRREKIGENIDGKKGREGFSCNLYGRRRSERSKKEHE